MNTKYDIGDKVLIEVTIREIRADGDGITYYVLCPEEFGTTIKEKSIYGLSEAKETSFKEYLDEQMKDPEFKKEYNKLEKVFEKEYDKLKKKSEKKIIINVGFRNALRDAIYRKGDVACNISKTLGLPANCLTNIILGHTKNIAYGRLCWICNALNITEEDIING